MCCLYKVFPAPTKDFSLRYSAEFMAAVLTTEKAFMIRWFKCVTLSKTTTPATSNDLMRKRDPVSPSPAKNVGRGEGPKSVILNIGAWFLIIGPAQPWSGSAVVRLSRWRLVIELEEAPNPWCSCSSVSIRG